MKKDLALKGVAVLLLLLMTTAQATVWYVHPDSTLNSIQAGIDLCSTGDTILVGPGSYVENINFNGMAITVTSECGADTTIIDGSNPSHPDTGSVVLFISGEDTTSVLDGFRIINGSGTYDPSYGPLGGGISCRFWSSPTIMNNTITNNTANFGGGISCEYDVSPKIINNTISNNSVTDAGGGIDCGYNCLPTIVGNTIIGNTAYLGGGIASSGTPTITNNNISGNIAEIQGGGGIFCIITSPTINSCTITGNHGDGVLCAANSDPEIHYNDITDNIGYAVRNTDVYVTVIADSNWWGDATGPYHPTFNPGGLGDTVSDHVDFEPWLYEPWGVEEEPTGKPVEEYVHYTATIFCGSLHLPEGKNCKVFDITGRVVEPARMAPGIYFIEIDGVVTQKVVKVR